MARVGLDRSDAGRVRTARPGDTVVIHLDESPTSGYRWTVEEVDPAVLRPAGDYYAPPGPGRGGRGRRELRFTVVGRGSSRLRLALRRPWAPAGPATRRYETTIDVVSAGREGTSRKG